MANEGKTVAAGCAGVSMGLLVFSLVCLAVLTAICLGAFGVANNAVNGIQDGMADAMTRAEEAADADKRQRLEALAQEIDGETDPARLELLGNRLAELEAEYATDEREATLAEAGVDVEARDKAAALWRAEAAQAELGTTEVDRLRAVYCNAMADRMESADTGACADGSDCDDTEE